MTFQMNEEVYLAHIGVIRRSGRYPWGSGDTPYQRHATFLTEVHRLRKEGLTNAQIAKGMGISTKRLVARVSISSNEKRAADIARVYQLKERGMSNTAIGEAMGGINESTVRGLYAAGQKSTVNALTATANKLEEAVLEKGYIDVGSGVEQHLGVSDTRLKTAVTMLEERGYNVYNLHVPQAQGTNKTTIRTLTKPETTYADAHQNMDKIQQVTFYSKDLGHNYETPGPPLSISSKRLAINYAEDGGTDADGVVYVRPGAENLSFGDGRYAQVRIAVDGTHYIKGMAVYRDDLPDGVDLLFNTNKPKGTPVLGPKNNSVLKLLEYDKDPENPFGSTIDRDSGAMNILRDEGVWEGWSRKFSSQFLSKQDPTFAKQQLQITRERKQQELDDILALTNPVVRQRLLDAYADSVDSAAVHLKAATLPRTANHVLLPVPTMKSNEVYAPNFNNGERVVLVRHPHGGTFEIPELVVNNKNADAQRLVGKNARDAIGINAKVAQRLSGADFDGDTVLVIPNDRGSVKVSDSLTELKNFDPQAAYPAYKGMKTMRNTQTQMGEISNLITDMTIQGATQSELARAVKHSMVVIDAEKHNLNYRESAKQNQITQLKKKYQGNPRGGASTLISRAGSKKRIDARKPRLAKDGGPIDKKTGKKVYVKTGETYVNKKGEVVTKKAPGKYKKLALTDDAYTLSSGTRIESIYADHSNALKSLANRARRESVNTKKPPVSRSAKAAYAKELDDLNAKLDLAIRNRPLERQAQVLANSEVRRRKANNPDMDDDDVKRVERQALSRARERTGAKANDIFITEPEWNAIQAGALSSHKLSQILQKADLEQVKKLATPRDRPKMTDMKIRRAQTMANAGYTQAEIAQQLGVSPTTISVTLSEGG